MGYGFTEYLRKLVERDALAKESCFLPTCKFVSSGKLYRIDVELDLLDQAITYGEVLRDGPELCKKSRSSYQNLDELKKLDLQLEVARPPGAPISDSHQSIWTVPSFPTPPFVIPPAAHHIGGKPQPFS